MSADQSGRVLPRCEDCGRPMPTGRCTLSDCFRNLGTSGRGVSRSPRLYESLGNVPPGVEVIFVTDRRGDVFPGLRVIRHRLFESNLPLTAPAHGRHPLVFTHDKRKRHYGQLDQDIAFVQVTGGGNCSIANARAAMGIDWMDKDGLNQAVPPAYAEHIGQQLLDHIERQAAA